MIIQICPNVAEKINIHRTIMYDEETTSQKRDFNKALLGVKTNFIV